MNNFGGLIRGHRLAMKLQFVEVSSQIAGMGFKAYHADRLANAILNAGERTIDGLQFEISGTLTSVFRQDENGRRLICQVYAANPAI